MPHRLSSQIGILLLLALGTWRSSAAQDAAAFANLRYRMVGPTRGGRVTAVAGDRSRPGTFYMGATGGGVWKTTDYGDSWSNVSDGYFQTPSIGAIRVADSDPNVVYVGTGSDGIRSNVIAGRGVYKSTDAGETWTFLGLRETGQIGAVLIHPTNADLVYVAALGHAFGPNRERGVYRTRDGGRTWDQVLFISDSTGAIDLEFAPDNPNEIYASLWHGQRKPWTIISGAREGGVYKSADGGDTWNRLGEGLPSGLVGKSDLAVSAADPNRVYVLIEAQPGGGLYRSDDRGVTFRLVSDYAPLLDRPFYYTNLDADPTNADVLYANTTQFWKSTDAGKTWQRRSTPHGDNHDMWIDPDDPNLFIQSNDGGANVTRDGGRTWSTQDNQPTAELYQVDVDDQFPYWLYAGQQDASTIAVPSLPPYSAPGGPTAFWRDVGGCETGPAVPKPGHPDIVYSNCKGRFGRYDKRTGQEQQYYVRAWNMYGHDPKDLPDRFQRVSPIATSPHDPNVVYHASQYLYRTRDEGITWERISPDLTAFAPDKQGISGGPITRDITGEEFYSTLYAVAESPLEPGVIWTGANDGPVHVTRDGGKTWSDVTPKGLPPGGRVQNIEPSPHRRGKAYVAVYRWLLDDYQPYIYRTTDYGKSWTRITTGRDGIPADDPTWVVREDPMRAGLLYAGTHFGMFLSFDDGAHWQAFQQNLPITPVTDIEIHGTDLVASTMGRSFWILDDVTPVREWSRQVAQAPAHLFQPRPAYRMRYFGFRRSSSEPEYLPAGAVLDYYFAIKPSDEVTLEILDADGTVVRAFSTASEGSRLPADAGHNRFVWDLAYPGPTSSGSRGFGRGGPMAVPGTYRVRLAVGSWHAERALEVKADPRMTASGVTLADMQAQLDLNLKIRDAVSAARGLQARVERTLQQATGSRRERLEAIKAQLVTASGIAYPQPMLVDQVQYLYGMTTRADQRPGQDAYNRYEALRQQIDRLTAAVEAVATTPPR